MKSVVSPRKKNSPPKSLDDRVASAKRAIMSGSFDREELQDPQVVGKLSEQEQLTLWRAIRAEWLGDDGRSSVDDLYREQRLSKEFHGFRLVPSNAIKKLKGTPPKKAAIEAESLGGEVRWWSERDCPAVVFKFPCIFAETKFSRWALKPYGLRRKGQEENRDKESPASKAIAARVANLSPEEIAVLAASYDLWEEELPIAVFDTVPLCVRAQDWVSLMLEKTQLEYVELLMEAEDRLINKHLIMDRLGDAYITGSTLDEVERMYTERFHPIAIGETFRLTNLGIAVAEAIPDEDWPDTDS